MKSSTFATLKGYLRTAQQWFSKSPERALNEAYEAALMIKGIEDAHFNGGRISADYGNYSPSVQEYFQAELKKYLKIAKVQLTEFIRLSELQSSSSVLHNSEHTITEIQLSEDTQDWRTIEIIDKPTVILKKLKFIDETIIRYDANQPTNSYAAAPLAIAPDPSQVPKQNRRVARPADPNGRFEKRTPAAPKRRTEQLREAAADSESFTDKTGVLPRSILRTVDRIKRELDPKAEEEVVENFRDSKTRTIVSLRFILLLIIIPLLTQQVSKNFLVGPIVDQFRDEDQSNVFLNLEMEEEALHELQQFDERLRFEILIGKTPAMSEEEIGNRVREKAEEVEEIYRERSSDAIKNIFSDIFSLAAFAGVIYFSKREIAILKSFIDEIVYGLSDSAKAFIIILFTDTFVGFHSPHGWEVLLEGISRHLGLPANRDFIFLFIATFPVILDTVFKYWIFRYLNRISPSAVATYKNMNE